MDQKTREILEALMEGRSTPRLPAPGPGYGLSDRLDSHYDRALPSPGMLPQQGPSGSNPMRPPQFPQPNMREPDFEPDLMPGMGADPRGMFWQEGRGNSFQPGAEYQTADLAGLKPSGVGEESAINNAARAYRTLMAEMDAYEQNFRDGGGTFLPGAQRDRLDTGRRNIQMQMKELYNLGVLNGPDLELMDQILLSPTSISGNVMDRLGIADLDKRIPDNVAQVRRMMTNLVEPKLQMIGLEPEDVLPKRDPSQMSDEEVLQQLLGN